MTDDFLVHFLEQTALKLAPGQHDKSEDSYDRRMLAVHLNCLSDISLSREKPGAGANGAGYEKFVSSGINLKIRMLTMVAQGRSQAAVKIPLSKLFDGAIGNFATEPSAVCVDALSEARLRAAMVNLWPAGADKATNAAHGNSAGPRPHRRPTFNDSAHNAAAPPASNAKPGYATADGTRHDATRHPIAQVLAGARGVLVCVGEVLLKNARLLLALGVPPEGTCAQEPQRGEHASTAMPRLPEVIEHDFAVSYDGVSRTQLKDLSGSVMLTDLEHAPSSCSKGNTEAMDMIIFTRDDAGDAVPLVTQCKHMVSPPSATDSVAKDGSGLRCNPQVEKALLLCERVVKTYWNGRVIWITTSRLPKRLEKTVLQNPALLYVGAKALLNLCPLLRQQSFYGLHDALESVRSSAASSAAGESSSRQSDDDLSFVGVDLFDPSKDLFEALAAAVPVERQ